MKTRWYKDAVIYQIYPRSFCDGNGDGIGDIRGIISKLDYLKDLGIDAVWLSPCYKSPNDDNGYDISDYREIMDEFGTLEDWQEMVDGMHERGIKLIMDLVVNHSSDEHKWFKESRSSIDNPYRDYYIWSKGRGKNGKKPPNKWRANFLGKAWEYDENTKEYYLHLFSKKQPDLNWDNPKVRQEVIDICNYWLEKGVDGFRCDVITYIAKDFNADTNQYTNYVLGSHWEEYISQVNRESWSKYDTLVVGECAAIDREQAVKITDETKPLLDTAFTFEHMYIDAVRKLKLSKLKLHYNQYQNIPKECWISNYIENHDQPRCLPRYGDDKQYRKQSATMLANSIFFLRGTPYIYQGQEIGMTNCPFEEDEYKDIMSVNVISMLNRHRIIKKLGMKILAKKARDNARTPMQWSAEKYAGFSTAQPWMKINPNYTEINVKSDLASDFSVIEYYKKLMKIRKKHIDIIRDGNYTDLMPKSEELYIYTRSLDGKTLFVECNFTGLEQRVIPPEGLDFEHSELLLANYESANTQLIPHTLRPYESKVYLLTK